jgi:hypothetical protein
MWRSFGGAGLDMKRIARILAAIFLAFAMIFLVIDGTRMLAANAFVVTPLAGSLDEFVPGTAQLAQEFIETSVHPLLWDPVITTLLSWPGWAVFGVLGIALAFLGRSPDRRRLISIDQF